MFVPASRGEHLHAVKRGNSDRSAQGYRLIGWDISDGTVTDVRVFDRDGNPTTLEVLEPAVRQGGRRVEMVPFSVVGGCCDLHERR